MQNTNNTRQRKNIKDKIFNKEVVKKTTVATFIGVVPGSFIFVGAYLVANRLKNNYSEYKLTNPEINFNEWFKRYGYADMKGYAYENFKDLRVQIRKIKEKTKITKKSL